MWRKLKPKLKAPWTEIASLGSTLFCYCTRILAQCYTSMCFVNMIITARCFRLEPSVLSFSGLLPSGEGGEEGEEGEEGERIQDSATTAGDLNQRSSGRAVERRFFLRG